MTTTHFFVWVLVFCSTAVFSAAQISPGVNVQCAATEYYTGSGSTCAQCPTGYYCQNSQRYNCELSGQYCNAVGLTAPKNCPSNNYCPDGVNIYACPAGTSSSAGSASINECQNTITPVTPVTPVTCDPGNYKSGATCTPCPIGYYCQNEQMYACATAGTYCISTGLSAAVPCSAGSYCRDGVHIETTECDTSNGHVINDVTGCTNVACTCCPPPPANGSFVGDPRNCMWECDDGYELTSDWTRCTPCHLPANADFTSDCWWQCSAGFKQVGQHYDVDGGTCVRECGIGYYYNEWGLSCLPCPAGTYSDATDVTECIIAPPSETGCKIKSTVGCTTIDCVYRATPVPKPAYSSFTTECEWECSGGAVQLGMDKNNATCIFDCPLYIDPITGNFGQYSYYDAASKQCASCPPGSFKYSPDLLPCYAPSATCPLGYIANSGNCDACPPGYSCNGISQVPCAAGSYSLSGQPVCTPCHPGTYSSTVGNTQCSPCIASTYSTPGLSVCLPCPPGAFCLSGTPAPTPCDAGRYSSVGASVCTQCPAKKYSPTGASVCSPCPAGSYCLAGTSDPTPCEAGKYSVGGVSQCTMCSAGTYSVDGQSVCVNGTCPGGYYYYTGFSNCVQCEGYGCCDGKVKTPCPLGFISTVGCTTCFKACPIGKYADPFPASTCTQCAPGTYSTSEWIPNNASCLECTGGTYSSIAGASNCNLCPAGRYSVPGRTTCSRCEYGTYTTGMGTANCTGCAAGSYSLATGASTAVNCSLCETGKYSPGTGYSECILCIPGHYCWSGATRAIPCNAGSYSSARGAADIATCNKCATGTYSPSYGYTACISCIPGHYCSSSGVSNPTACPVGTFSTATGASTVATCDSCAAGTYTPETGSTTCVQCTTGHYCPLGSPSPTACPVGTFSTATGKNSSTQCLSCAAGTYSSIPGSTACVSCGVEVQSITPLGAASYDECRTAGGVFVFKTEVCDSLQVAHNSYTQATCINKLLYGPPTSKTYDQIVCDGCGPELSCDRYAFTPVFGDYSGICMCCKSSCAPGTSVAPDGVCKPCAYGTYSNGTDQVQCTLCASGTYTSATTPCAADTTPHITTTSSTTTPVPTLQPTAI